MLHNHHSQKETQLLKLQQEVADVPPTHVSLAKVSHMATPLFKGGKEVPSYHVPGGEGRTEIFLNDIIFNHSDPPHIFT